MKIQHQNLHAAAKTVLGIFIMKCLYNEKKGLKLI